MAKLVGVYREVDEDAERPAASKSVVTAVACPEMTFPPTTKGSDVAAGAGGGSCRARRQLPLSIEPGLVIIMALDEVCLACGPLNPDAALSKRGAKLSRGSFSSSSSSSSSSGCSGRSPSRRGGSNLPATKLNGLKGERLKESSYIAYMEREAFLRKFDKLAEDEELLASALRVSFSDVTAVLAAEVSCVGCRRAAEGLLTRLQNICAWTGLDPLVISEDGTVAVNAAHLKAPKALAYLLCDQLERFRVRYIPGSSSTLKNSAPYSPLINTMVGHRKGVANGRCPAHSLTSMATGAKDNAMVAAASADLQAQQQQQVQQQQQQQQQQPQQPSLYGPSSGYFFYHGGNYGGPHGGPHHRLHWLDTWECMERECQEEVVLIHFDLLKATLDRYLKKYRFCAECTETVNRAYDILIGACSDYVEDDDDDADQLLDESGDEEDDDEDLSDDLDAVITGEGGRYEDVAKTDEEDGDDEAEGGDCRRPHDGDNSSSSSNLGHRRQHHQERKKVSKRGRRGRLASTAKGSSCCDRLAGDRLDRPEDPFYADCGDYCDDDDPVDRRNNARSDGSSASSKCRKGPCDVDHVSSSSSSKGTMNKDRTGNKKRNRVNMKLYSGISTCAEDGHVHVECSTDFVSKLIALAEPEVAGLRQERHAKTIEVAQTEVLTCIGICLLERFQRIQHRLGEGQQSCDILFMAALQALRRSFDMAFEQKQGISDLEKLCLELDEEERRKGEKAQKKRDRKLKMVAKKKAQKHLQAIQAADAETAARPASASAGNGSTDPDAKPKQSSNSTKKVKKQKPIVKKEPQLGKGPRHPAFFGGLSMSVSDPQRPNLTRVPPKNKNFPSLGSLLDVSIKEDVDEGFEGEDVDDIPIEVIEEYHAKLPAIERQREELRKNLRDKFNQLCINGI